MINTRNLLIPGTQDGKNVVKLDTNENKMADGKDLTLVKKDENGEWQTVDKVDGPINREEMANSYALWQDEEVLKSKGMLWWKKTEVVRPKDGKIDADEVQTLELRHRGPESYREIGARDFFVGAEVATSQTAMGSFTFMSMVTHQYNDRMVDARLYAKQDAEAFRKDDSNWLVK